MQGGTTFLCAGERLLDGVGEPMLEPIEAWGTGLVTHISYKVGV